MAIEWTEKKLLALIAAGTEENTVLEYKRSAALENTEQNKGEISKDVSAFANSGGGELFYGIRELHRKPERSMKAVTLRLSQGMARGGDQHAFNQESWRHISQWRCLQTGKGDLSSDPSSVTAHQARQEVLSAVQFPTRRDGRVGIRDVEPFSHPHTSTQLATSAASELRRGSLLQVGVIMKSGAKVAHHISFVLIPHSASR
jgi:hypothetical protein